MKKIVSLILVLVVVLSMGTMAFAEGTGGTTTLTTTVPNAKYTLNIPANHEIEFGETSTEIGNITVTGGENFAEGKNVKVTLTYGDFTAESVSTTIPFALTGSGTKTSGGTNYSASCDLISGAELIYLGLASGGVSEHTMISRTESSSYTYEVPMNSVYVKVNSNDWGKALAGDYTAIITFTSEVVVEE